MDGSREFQGKDLDSAIEDACNYFNTSRERLEIEILQDATSGLFGFLGAKKAKIRARRASLDDTLASVLGSLGSRSRATRSATSRSERSASDPDRATSPARTGSQNKTAHSAEAEHASASAGHRARVSSRTSGENEAAQQADASSAPIAQARSDSTAFPHREGNADGSGSFASRDKAQQADPEKPARPELAENPDRAAKAERADKHEKPARSDRTDRSERPERPERQDRALARREQRKAERGDAARSAQQGKEPAATADSKARGQDPAERPERTERLERPERSERSERPERPGREKRNRQGRDKSSARTPAADNAARDAEAGAEQQGQPAPQSRPSAGKDARRQAQGKKSGQDKDRAAEKSNARQKSARQAGKGARSERPQAESQPQAAPLDRAVVCAHGREVLDLLLTPIFATPLVFVDSADAAADGQAVLTVTYDKGLLAVRATYCPDKPVPAGAGDEVQSSDACEVTGGAEEPREEQRAPKFPPDKDFPCKALFDSRAPLLAAIHTLVLRLIEQRLGVRVRLSLTVVQTDAAGTLLRSNEVSDPPTYRDRLEIMARNMAEQVLRTGKTLTTKPLNASQRRIIHLALRKVPGIATKSTGQGAVKRVLILRKDETSRPAESTDASLSAEQRVDGQTD